MPTPTTSVRLDPDLRMRLELIAQVLGKDRSWVISKAVEEYCKRHGRQALAAEARRQSLIASRKDEPRELDAWLSAADLDEWK